ncbi:CheR family methyltransferase [Bacteriovorax sp. PP10]|uniref:CheR family methyltransferase n=1 Tax=Bacteriovorax antarcticus TaxID=3088717 RepID=A0ABU5VZM0_9BACT|nr:CheR family methyltransferase [Bacteriovorax sp. PP10]MEA9357818.1 CheR family methyltransferase [Bacteriovorax sp. PP10]
MSFEQFNLKNGNYQDLNRSFDLIFCRNVMIYFTPETIAQIAEGLFQNAAPEAVLIISHSESLQNLKTNWKVKGPSIYTKGQLFL